MRTPLVLVALLIVGCTKSDDAKDREIAALRAQLAGKPAPAPAGGLGAVKAQPVAVPIPAPEAKEESENNAEGPMTALMATESLADAIKLTLPMMSDTHDKQSPGTLALAVWAAQHLKWDDVNIKKDETSFARVRKDSDEERGKRMCYAGMIIQIEKERGVRGLYSGLLITWGRDIIAFLAAGSTGDLVARHNARFCGAVTGTYDYSNSGGGVGHAVSMVGMFDIAENNPKKKRARASDDD